MSSTAMESPSPNLSVAGTPSFCRSVMSENEAVLTEMTQVSQEEGMNSSWSEDQQQQHGEEVTCTPYTNIRNESVIECNGSEISSDSNNNSPAASVEVISTEVGQRLAAEVFESDAFATKSPLPSSRKIRAVEVNLFESSPAGGIDQCVLESVPLYPTSPEEKVLIEQRKIPSGSSLESFDTHLPISELSHLKHFAIIIIAVIILMIPHFTGISGPQSSSLRQQLAIDHPFKNIPMYLTQETSADVGDLLEADFVDSSLLVPQQYEPVQQAPPPTTQQPSSNPFKMHVLISVNKTPKSRQEPEGKGLKRQLSRALGSVNSSARSVTSKIACALTHWAHSVEQVLLPHLDGDELEYMPL